MFFVAVNKRNTKPTPTHNHTQTPPTHAQKVMVTCERMSYRNFACKTLQHLNMMLTFETDANFFYSCCNCAKPRRSDRKTAVAVVSFENCTCGTPRPMTVRLFQHACIFNSAFTSCSCGADKNEESLMFTRV